VAPQPKLNEMKMMMMMMIIIIIIIVFYSSYWHSCIIMFLCRALWC